MARDDEISLDDKVMHDKITLIYNRVACFYGVLPGICNIIEGDIEGGSVSGLTIIGGDAKGIYSSVIGNQINGNAKGVYTGLCNDVNGNVQGLFVGALNQAGKLKATKTRINGCNITLPAMQIGFVNYAKKCRRALCTDRHREHRWKTPWLAFHLRHRL